MPIVLEDLKERTRLGLGDWLAGGNGMGKWGAQCSGIWLGRSISIPISQTREHTQPGFRA